MPTPSRIAVFVSLLVALWADTALAQTLEKTLAGMAAHVSKNLQ